MPLAAVDQRRILLRTDRLCLPAARPEPATRRRVGRVRHVALEHDPLALPALARLLDRNRGEQCLRVRMRWALVDVRPGSDLDDTSEVHDGDAVGDVPHEREIVRDEEVRQPEVPLQRLEQVDDLRPDRNVERGHRLVEHHHLRIERESAREADALALAAGELVREAVGVLGAQADRPEQLYAAPGHPYTRALLSAVPVPDPVAERMRKRVILKGDVPSPVNPPSACRFHPRCPRFVEGHCDVEEPQLRSFGEGHIAKCHYPLERWPMTSAEMRRRGSAEAHEEPVQA